MNRRLRFLAALAAAAPLACASAPAASPVPACSGFTPPLRLSTGPSSLPDSFLAARAGGEVVDEVVIQKDGSVGAIRLARSRIAELAPYGEASVRRSRFSPASIEGNPVSARVLVSTAVGIMPSRPEPAYDSLWAHTPGGETREARWQLAGSVERLAVQARVAAAPRDGVRIVAVAPDGAERILWKGSPPSESPAEIRETVKTSGFFARSGDYRLELRAGDRVLAAATLTIAPDFQTAIVNACEPVKSR